MSRFLLVLLNTLSFVAVIIFNALAGTGRLGDYSMGEMSAKYNTLITPAAYAFSIWGLIYVMLTCLVIFQWWAHRNKRFDETIDQVGYYFLFSNLLNIAWLLLWLNEFLGLSVLVMFLLLLSLVKIVVRLNMERWDAPVRLMAFIWWPIAVYLGWIIVASVTNVAAFLVSMQWDGFPLTPEMWTIIMISVAMAIYLILIFTRNLRESAMVGVWAFIAIAVKQISVDTGVASTAISAAVFLLAAALYHGYKNRSTAPHEKIKRGEI